MWGPLRHKNAKSTGHAKKLRGTMTKAEVVLWTNLRPWRRRGHWFRRQHPIGPYIADFAHVEVMLVIEVDGATHSSADEVAYDAARDAYMQKIGWTVMRVRNEEIYADVASVVETILRRVSPSVSPLRGDPPPPLKRGRIARMSKRPD